MCIRKTSLLLFLFLLIAVPGYTAGNSAYKVSPQIPLDSWIYPAMDRVTALCKVKTSLAGTRPLTRLEAARLLGEQPVNVGNYYLPPKVVQLLSRLKFELRDELAYLGDETGVQVKAPDQPLRSMTLSYTYQDGAASAFPGTDARQVSLNDNNFGREFDNNHNAAFSVMGDLRLFDNLLLSWQPLVSQLDEDGTEFDLLSAVAALNLGGVELSAGRQSLWWGQGRHGSLLLSNNAAPLDMLRLTNPSPMELPWLFKYLGPFRFDSFVSRLDDKRAVPEPYFGGLRFNFRPASWFEFGAARTVMFGGDGRPNVSGSDFLTIIGGHNLSGKSDTSNSIAGIDARLILPFWGVQLYGELYGEDEAGMLMSKNSWLGGLYLPQVDPAGLFSLRVEYADTTRIGSDDPVLYSHYIYTSGYINEGQIMGHHVGSDSTDLSLQLSADFSDKVSANLGFDVEERGKSQPLQEKHSQVDLEILWQLDSNLTAKARGAYDSVENWNFVKGDQDFYMTSLGVEYNF